MNKIILLMICLVLFISSCDSESCSEEIILNNTSSDLYINFNSLNDSFNNQFIIEKQSRKTINQVKCDLGGVVVNYSVYDSIYIQNSTNDILKVYKDDTEGKNIYNISEYWYVNETSKNHFVYTYEITEEDLE